MVLPAVDIFPTWQRGKFHLSPYLSIYFDFFPPLKVSPPGKVFFFKLFYGRGGSDAASGNELRASTNICEDKVALLYAKFKTPFVNNPWLPSLYAVC